jgi:hypothetical protein
LANYLTQDLINKAAPYWLEVLTFTFQSNLQPGNGTSVFSVQNWQSGMQVELTSLGVTQWPGLQIQVNADGDGRNYYADAFPPSLGRLAVGARAFRNMSLALLNTSAYAAPIEGIYTVTLWAAPVAEKVLLGQPLTAAESRVASEADIGTAAAEQTGLLPIPLAKVKQDSYLNRRVSAGLTVSQSYVVATAGTAVPILSRPTLSNQLQILTSAALEAGYDENASLNISRDDEIDMVQVGGQEEGLEHPYEFWVPARTTLAVQLQSTAPAGGFPVRIERIAVALSYLLRVRTGQITESQIAQSLLSQKLQAGVERTKAQRDASSEAHRIVILSQAGRM